MVSTLPFVFEIIRPNIFSAVKNPQSTVHSQGNFPQSSKFSTVKEIFTINGIFHNQGIFLQSRNFSTIKETFTIQKFSAKKDQKDFLKAKILDAFNTKSYAKLLLTLF